jgi:hypothetical protein
MDAFDINARLLKLQGYDTTYQLPKWRLVWSDLEVIKRTSVYKDVTPSGIYLGWKKGTREIKKYWYLKPSWILERLDHIQRRVDFDEIQRSYTYELVYAFLDRNDNPLPLAWAPIEFILHNWGKAERATYAATYAEAQAKKEVEDVKKARDIIEADDPKWQPTFKSSVILTDADAVKEEIK